jgi:hypothetical protein
LQDWLPLVISDRVNIEAARDVVEPLNVVLLARTAIRVAEPLLEVKGWDGLVIERHLHVINTGHGLRIQWDQVFDLVGAREQGVCIVGVELLRTRKLGQLLDEGLWVLGEHGRVEPFRP